jgi:sugar phosphate isomerase/epimerase
VHGSFPEVGLLPVTVKIVKSITMNRREFVRTAVVGAVAARRLPPLASRPLPRIGLELYSVRDAMRRDPEGTLAAVRAIGYDDVELLWSMNNFGRTPQQVRATLDKEGLRAPSAHIDPKDLLNDWPAKLDTAKLLGHDYLIVPSLPDEQRMSLDQWRQWADRFNTAGAAARTAGLWLAFHNEPDHMKPVDGQVPYDVFVARTDPSVVRLQLDVGNMAMGGGDPMAYLQRYRDRYWSFHIKDVVADRSRDTELGAGVLDIHRILAAIPDIERKPLYVEQEAAKDSLASAKANFEYLRRLAL